MKGRGEELILRAYAGIGPVRGGKNLTNTLLLLGKMEIRSLPEGSGALEGSTATRGLPTV